MGEAQRRLKRQMDGIEDAPVGLPVEKRKTLADSLRKAIGAVTDSYGSDCVLYAFVGAEVLRRMGLDAKAVAGVASWRVGPGDGDVISHAISLSNVPKGTVAGVAAGSTKGMAGMFHAWIAVGHEIIDFTTYSLRHKAQQLDLLDGGKTQVSWCPDYLWVKASTSKGLAAVAQAPNGGCYSYERVAGVEEIVFKDKHEADVMYVADIVETAMKVALTGNEVKVFGVGGGVLQDEDSARFMAAAKGLVRFRG